MENKQERRIVVLRNGTMRLAIDTSNVSIVHTNDDDLHPGVIIRKGDTTVHFEAPTKEQASEWVESLASSMASVAFTPRGAWLRGAVGHRHPALTETTAVELLGYEVSQ